MFQCLNCSELYHSSDEIGSALAFGCRVCGAHDLHPCVEWAEGDRAELPAPVPAAGADEPCHDYLARQAARMAGPEEDDADGEDDGGSWAEYRHRVRREGGG